MLRALLFVYALFFPFVVTAQSVETQQEDLLSKSVAAVEKSRTATPELYVLAAGMNSREDVFKNDVESMRDLLDRHWGSAGRSIALRKH